MTDRDAQLAALLDAVPAPDPAFSRRVMALVEADAAWARARQAAWRRFGFEAAGVVAVGLAALALAQGAGPVAGVPSGSGLAGALTLLSWLLTRREGRLAF